MKIGNQNFGSIGGFLAEVERLLAVDAAGARALLERALKKEPRSAALQGAMGKVLLDAGNPGGAIPHLRKACAFDVRNPDHGLRLGAALMQAGDTAGALEAVDRLLTHNPGHVEGRLSKARLLVRAGEAEVADLLYASLVHDVPSSAEILLEYAAMLLDIGNSRAAQSRLAASDAALRKLLALIPFHPFGLERYGANRGTVGQADAGFHYCRRALLIDPVMVSARINLAGMALIGGQFRRALHELRLAAAMLPDAWMVYANMAGVLEKGGAVQEARRPIRQALRLAPAHLDVWSTLLAMGLRDNEGDSRRDLADFTAMLTTQFPQGRRPVPSRPDRRLRIGYYSPDFRQHSCAWFLAPLLAAHDRSRVDVHAYAEVVGPDSTTEHLASLVEHWRNTAGMSDDALAAVIEDDGIDVLFDLAGHFSGGRPGLFARRAAPVQVNWLGFNGSTGVPAMDWKLVDSVLSADLEDLNEYSEKLWVLPRVSHCYQPPAAAPAPARQAARPLTFGSFNNLAKLSGETITLWARVLTACPEAVLLQKAETAADVSVQRRILEAFAGRGIAPERLRFMPYAASILEHLAAYGQVDIGLDPTPYNGTTTTCEALWMGVPVVTLAGRRLVARVGASLLDAAGLAELIAADEDAYVKIAAELARAPARLDAYRSGLRGRVAASPLCDAEGFARALETACEEMRIRAAGGA